MDEVDAWMDEANKLMEDHSNEDNIEEQNKLKDKIEVKMKDIREKKPPRIQKRCDHS